MNLDRAYAARFLFQHRHPQKTPWFHPQIMTLWQSDHPLVMTECFRGAGKSTLSEEFILLEHLFQNSQYSLLVGESYDKACERLYAIKQEIKTNDRLLEAFGDMTGDTWRENEVILVNGTKIEAVGRDQEQRGYKHGTYRPQRIIIDDAEKRKEIENTKYRREVWRWIFSEILPSLDPTEGKIRVIGTSLHPQSLIMRLKASADWVKLVVPLHSGSGKFDKEVDQPNWPSRFNPEWIRTTEGQYTRAGEWISYLREYMCVAVDLDNKTFDVNHLTETAVAPLHLPMLIAYDPARTIRETSDRTGFAAGAWSGTKLYLFETWGKRLLPSEITHDIFRANTQWAPMHLGVETNSLDEFILQPVRSEMLRRRTAVPLMPLRAPGQKGAFIRSLQPFVAAGDLILVGEDHADLRNEMEAYPGGTDDVLNAVAYLLLMRPGKPVYEDFGPEHIAYQEPDFRYPLILAANHEGQLTTAALLQTDGMTVWVYQDWAGFEPPADFIRQVFVQVKAEYPRLNVSVHSPRDLHERWTTDPLATALRKMNQLQVSGYRNESYGSLKEKMQQTVHHLPCLQVSPQARWTKNGLAGGYCHEVEVGGLPKAEALLNDYAVMVRGIECVVKEWGQQDALSGGHYAVHEGQRYLTSRPN